MTECVRIVRRLAEQIKEFNLHIAVLKNSVAGVDDDEFDEIAYHIIKCRERRSRLYGCEFEQLKIYNEITGLNLSTIEEVHDRINASPQTDK